MAIKIDYKRLPFPVNDVLGSTTVTSSAEETYSDITVFQRSDMTIANTNNIAQRYYVEESGEAGEVWVTKQMGFNISGELVYVKVYPYERTAPSFIPGEILE